MTPQLAQYLFENETLFRSDEVLPKVDSKPVVKVVESAPKETRNEVQIPEPPQKIVESTNQVAQVGIHFYHAEPEQESILKNIATACKLTENLFDQLPERGVFSGKNVCFGAKYNVRSAEMYKVLKNGDVEVIFADSLQAISQDKTLKSKLWAAVQVLFQL